MRYRYVAVGACFALAACQPSTSPTPGQVQVVPAPSAAPPAAAPVADAVPAITDAQMSIEPSRLDACDPAVEATVRWNVTRPSAPAQVDIYASDKLFTQGGASGEAKTGPWTRPGTTLTMKLPGGGETIATVRVGGPNCPEG